jgi:DNA-binding winged helix-turn-helix (wHTH) protein/tetratricopeptide (TPR) repeat protein/TolB-like protein
MIERPDTEPDAHEQPARARVAAKLYRFEGFVLDEANRLLTLDGREVALPGRAFDVLLELVRHPGQLLTKEDLLNRVWEGSFVEESNLTVAVSTLRRALGETAQDRRFIHTVARRGYRFIAEVEAVEAVAPVTPVVESKPVKVSAQPAVAPAIVNAASERRRRWTLTVIYAVLLLMLGVVSWRLLKPRTPLRSLAVLPMRVAAGSAARPSEMELLEATDEVATRLGSRMAVRPTSSVLRYSQAAAGVDPVSAGREQDVDAVLTGVVSAAKGGWRLDLRLVRVRDGVTLWKDSFRASGLPELQAAAGAGALKELERLGATMPPRPRASESPLAQANNPAYPLYLQGRYFWNQRTPDAMRKAVESFRQAIDANPNFAPAYSGLADAYALMASFSVEPGASANADARSAALSAIQLDPTLAEPHASLGMILFFTDWNLSGAEREFARAIELNPNYATAHHWYALDLAAMGRFAQAEYEIRLAQKLDPMSFIINTNVGWVETLARDNAAARRDLEHVLALDPSFARARTRLGMLELAEGHPAAALADLKTALDSGDHDPYVEGLLGDAQAQAGDRAAAEKTLADLEHKSAGTYVPPISRALVLIGLGRRDEAVAELGKAVADHSTSMVYARVDPTLDPLRGEPQFQQLLAKIAR